MFIFLAVVQSMQTSETNATEDICTHVYLAACEMKCEKELIGIRKVMLGCTFAHACCLVMAKPHFVFAFGRMFLAII